MRYNWQKTQIGKAVSAHPGRKPTWSTIIAALIGVSLVIAANVIYDSHHRHPTFTPVARPFNSFSQHQPAESQPPSSAERSAAPIQLKTVPN